MVMAIETCRTGGIPSKAMSDTNHPQAPTEARSSQRALVRRCGWYVSSIGQQLRECTVWDESETGARLVVDAPETIPDIFPHLHDAGFQLPTALPRGVAREHADRR